MLLILATTLLVTTAWVLVGVKGHGRLMDPPARNSMWRLGFANPVNYNDNELYCGGRMTQWARNSGKCGVCGDPHHAKREHEVGGKYANGIIAREYKQGDVVDVTVHVTANHKGFFEFRICPVEDPKVEVTQECLDNHVLEKADGNGTKYYLPESQSNQFFNVTVRLPNDLTCNQCVIQWKYRTGNTWDKDETGNFCVGCGPQEEFYNCADVSIRAKGTGSTKSSNFNNSNMGKLNGDAKKTAIVFTNNDSDTGYGNSVSKQGDYGSKKGKFTQETSKYSILSSDGNSMLGKKGKSSATSQENEIVIETLKKLSSPTNVLNSDIQLSLLDALSNNWVYPTGPSFVPYKWQPGVSKKSEAEELQRRFAYGMGGSPLSNSMEKTINKGEQLIKESKLRQNPPTTTDSRLIDALRESNDDLKGKDENFLRKWRLLKVKHLAAQQALNKPGTYVTTPRQTKDKKVSQQFRQTLQTMRENGKSRHSTVSNSPFSSFSLESKRTIFRDENQTLPRSNSDQMSTGPVTTQRTMKKKLPTWLVTALRLKVNSEKEKTTKSEQQKMHPTNDIQNSYQEKWQHKQGSNGDERGDERVHHNSVLNKNIKEEKQSVINEVSSHQKNTQSKLDISSQQHPIDSYEQQDKQQSLAEVQIENQRLSKELDTKLNKEDTESLVRYIIATLLSRKNKVSEGIEKEILSDFNREKDDANVGHGLDHGSQWPNSKTGENVHSVLSNSEHDSNTAVNAKKSTGFPMRVQTAEKVSPQSYNGLIFGSDYGYNQGFASVPFKTKSKEDKPRVWASNNAYDNSAAMEAYRQQLNKLYGEQDHGKKSYNPELSQAVDYENPVHNRGIISTYQSTQPQLYSGWTDADSESVKEKFVQDPNHLWAMRAQKRQTFYHQQPKAEAPQLVCKALVAFGGGMDRWCTDNCNANFCPPTICVCKKQARTHVPLVSSYSTVENAVEKNADWEIHTPIKKNRHIIKPNHSSRRGQTMRNTPFYNPLLQNYPVSQQQATTAEKHQRPSWTVFNPFHTNAFLAPISTPDPFESYSGSSTKSKYLSPRLDGGERSKQHAKMDTYMNKKFAKNDVDQMFVQNSILPPTKYNKKSTQRSANDLPINSISWLQADKDYVDSDSASNLMSLQDNLIVPGESAFSGSQLEGVAANSAVPGRPRLNCRAVGVYRGLDHFDEWCETTCYSSMCPLLMCECDQ